MKLEDALREIAKPDTHPELREARRWRMLSYVLWTFARWTFGPERLAEQIDEDISW